MNTVERRFSSIGIFSLTRGGARLAVKLAESWPESILYLPRRLKGEVGKGRKITYFDEFRPCFAKAFKACPALICIMAAGIVVRSLNGLMTSKYTDPAIVVIDEKGRYAISLLSGHLGGANFLSAKAARALGGQAVITTATDVSGRPAIDILALQIDALIRPAENLKTINRLLAEGETVNIYSPWPLQSELLPGLQVCLWPFKEMLPDKGRLRQALQVPAVVLGCQTPPQDGGADILFLNPRNLSLGIGCRQGVDYEQVERAVRQVLSSFAIDTECFVNLASIDIKREEAALQQLSQKFDLPFLLYSKEDIEGLNGTYVASDLVKEKIGVGGVCEPTARLAARQGITIIAKQIIGPVTISVAMEKSWWWDWGRAEQNS